MTNNSESINQAIEVLKKGGIILYPTDTLWGIGCDATNFEAVEKINKLKSRSSNKSYIILLDDDRKLNRYVREVPNIAWDLVEFSEKPTTIVYPNGYNLAENLIAKDNTIGIRIVKKGIAHDLIKAFKKPIVATSANISKGHSPTSFQQIDEIIKKGVDYILEKPKEGYKVTNIPSKIIKIGLGGEFELIRK